MIYYVSQQHPAPGDGTREHPFHTIGQAARIALAGDTVLIDSGVYREWVDPENGGSGSNLRITYAAMEGAHPVISGAETVTGWQQGGNGVWHVSVPNSLFGEVNPYGEELAGDWYDGLGQVHHTGEVYLDGEAMYEAPSLEALPFGAEGRPYRWYAVVGSEITVLYGFFGDRNPNDCLTEIAVRPFCFFPRQTGRDYITVSGLELRHAATQWAPPTAFQPGAIGPNWSKGWIIERCRIHDVKCCGVSLGKKKDINDNAWSKDPTKSGSQTYTEMVFAMLQDSWCRERVGSHLVQDCEIWNCGQTGIVGCMGGAFSAIRRCHIHHVNIRGEFSGAEMAGIKLHAAIDTVIEGNCIHDCVRGVWLDWEAQGTAVRRNAFFGNREEDLFIEVCHGPCTAENNLLLSGRSFLNVSQGTALLHNLFAGKLRLVPDTSRFTLYHRPHSTMVGGVSLIYGGDDRFDGNIFLQGDAPCRRDECWGTSLYSSYGAETKAAITEPEMTALTMPVQMRNNVYLGGAQPCAQEESSRVSDFRPFCRVVEENGHYWLETNLYDAPADWHVPAVGTADLGVSFQSGQAYEQGDGSPLPLDVDFTGARRSGTVTAGPLETPAARVLLW